jgi:hypothetical protein
MAVHPSSGIGSPSLESEPPALADGEPMNAPLPTDLDIVAATPNGEYAGFCTISYDDYTRSAAIVLEGTAAEHLNPGLGEAMTIEGMRRLKHLGCTRVFSLANEEATNDLYRSVMPNSRVAEHWVKIWTPDEG